MLQDELKEIDAALSAGALVLVPNYRSSRQLQEDWSRWQSRQLHSAVLRVPAIQAIDLWLGTIWERLSLQLSSPVLGWHLLQPAEELLLWRQVIADSSTGAELLNIEGTAATARDTWRLLQQAGISPADLRSALSLTALPGEMPDDRQVYFQWLAAFVTLCKRKQLLTFGDLLHTLLLWSADDPAAIRGVLPPRILLRGFDDTPPLYSNLLAAFAELGVTMETVAGTQQTATTTVCRYGDVSGECRAAAEWARTTLAAEPSARIGIICPDLHKQHANLERIFNQTLPPQGKRSNLALASVEPLAEQPFIATALQVLELNHGTGTCSTLLLCQLLRSPWLQGAIEEADARARLELHLRSRAELRTSLATFRSACMQSGKPWYAPLLGQALLALEQARLRQPPTQAPLQWLQLFQLQWRSLLDQQALLASGNKALATAWQSLQDKCLRAAFLFEPGPLAEAKILVTSIARESTQAGNTAAASVQILGPGESAGLRFTHLWCMQMSEQHWPGDSHPNPWLPLQLQKDGHLPGADAQAALAKARRLLDNLQTATSTALVFSYSRFEDDLPLRPSQLIPALTLDANPEAALQENLPAALHPALRELASQQTVLTAESITLPRSAAQLQQGPSSLLADQAACPFRAFAIHRLKATELKALRYGLPPTAVGNLVHRTLEYFWQAMQSSAQLLQTAPDALRASIDAAVGKALRETAQYYPQTLTPAYQQVEKEHLVRLLTAWLEQERRRGAFSVLDNEQLLQWRFANLELKLRIDRIDRNLDGTTVVVDYKTGRVSNVKWQDERQEAPQLLLYQQALEQSGRYAPVSALLYARVNLEEVQYSGIAADEQTLPGLAFGSNRQVNADSWEALKQHWQFTLQALAQEYLNGHVAVQPKSRRSCEYCHLPSFCRIAEIGRPA